MGQVWRAFSGSMNFRRKSIRAYLTAVMLGGALGLASGQVLPPPDTSTPGAPGFIPSPAPPREVNWVELPAISARVERIEGEGAFLVAEFIPTAGSLGNLRVSVDLQNWSWIAPPVVQSGERITVRRRIQDRPLFIRYLELSVAEDSSSE